MSLAARKRKRTNSDYYEWLELTSGAQFFLEGPTHEVLVSDIADGLSRICRYAGNCGVHYSVAQHSVHVADYVFNSMEQGEETSLIALLHDAHEMITSDIPRPVKRMMSGDAKRELDHIEANIDYRIREGLGLVNLNTPAAEPFVKIADNVILATEKRDLKTTGPKWGGLPDPMTSLTIKPWDAATARQIFLERYEEYYRKLDPAKKRQFVNVVGIGDEEDLDD